MVMMDGENNCRGGAVTRVRSKAKDLSSQTLVLTNLSSYGIGTFSSGGRHSFMRNSAGHCGTFTMFQWKFKNAFENY